MITQRQYTCPAKFKTLKKKITMTQAMIFIFFKFQASFIILSLEEICSSNLLFFDLIIDPFNVHPLYILLVSVPVISLYQE